MRKSEIRKNGARIPGREESVGGAIRVISGQKLFC
jgi:hypothetical protein